MPDNSHTIDTTPRSPAVTFGLSGVAPPSALYIAEEDILEVIYITSQASDQLTIVGRMLLADGTISPFAFAPPLTANRTLTLFTIDLPEGYLLSIMANVGPSTVQRGQTYVGCNLHRGISNRGALGQVLFTGYVTGYDRIGWPGGKQESSVEGRGWLRSVAGTNPAAGVEISEAVPAGARWRFHAMRFTFATDATVANRTVNIVIDDGANPIWEANANFNQAASDSEFYCVGPSGVIGFFAAARNLIPVPIGLELAAGFRIRTVTSNLQAGDDYSAPQLLVEEWLSPS